MLNRKLQKEAFQVKRLFLIMKQVFQNDVDRLSAEHIMLHKKAEIKIEEFKTQLDADKMLPYVYTDDILEGQFLKSGILLADKKEQATEFLFSEHSQWIRSEDHRDFKNRRQRNADLTDTYKKYIFSTYFSKLTNIKPATSVAPLLTEYGHVYDKIIMANGWKLLSEIIVGNVEQGDSVLHIICPNYCHPKIHWKIDSSRYLPFLCRLFERQDDDLIATNSDIYSGDFIMAFVESFGFKVPEHKQEILLRLATLLLHDGMRI